MPSLLIHLALGSLGRDALKLAALLLVGLALAVALALAGILWLVDGGWSTALGALLASGQADVGAAGSGALVLPAGHGAGNGMPGGNGRPGSSGPPDPGGAPGTGDPDALGARIVAAARSQLGMPYVWGGASPQTSFDCSGLVQWAYAQAGLGIPRTAQAQYDATRLVPVDQLRPGDAVFFAHTYDAGPGQPITHVGIYLGNGLMINAPRTGEVVQVIPVFAGYWGDHVAGGGRVGRRG